MANKYYKERLIPSAATETVIYTVPTANAAVVRSLRVTNTGASTALITVSQYDGGTGTALVLQDERPLSAGATFDVFAGVPCVLEEGDTLEVLSSTANVHFYLTYLEMDRS